MRWLFPALIIFLLSACGSSPEIPKGTLPFSNDKLGHVVHVDSSLLPKNDWEITPFGAGKILLGDPLSKFRTLSNLPHELIYSFKKPIQFVLHYSDSTSLIVSLADDSTAKGMRTNSPQFLTPLGVHVDMRLVDIPSKKEILHPYAEDSVLHVTLEHEGIDVIPDAKTQKKYFADPDYELLKDSTATVAEIDI